MQKMRRFARYWDLVANSGNFAETARLLWTRTAENGSRAGIPPACQSPFWSFMRWSEWLYAQVGRTDSIALARLAELLFKYLTEELSHPAQSCAEALWRDYQRGGRRDKPEFLRPFIADEAASAPRSERSSVLKRQSRHLAELPKL